MNYYLIKFVDNTFSIFKVDKFYVEGGSLVLIVNNLAVAAFAPGYWLSMDCIEPNQAQELGRRDNWRTLT